MIYQRDYGYDPAGNRIQENRDGISITCGYNEANQINYRNNATEAINYQHDDNGNLLSETSNLNGATTYGYDYENRLISVQDAFNLAQFTYNGAWQRTSVSENANVVRYIYDAMLPVVERDSAGNTLAAYTRIPDIAGGIGGLVSRWNGTATHYYHNLMLDNVTRISDESGSIVQAYDYDAFGNVTAQTGSLINNYQFQDKELLPDFGLVFYGARYYKPILGIFINTDPLGMVDGPNLYRFCLGDPVNYLDPWGLMVGFGYMGGPAIGLGAGGIPGIPPPDIGGGGISQPGAAQINSGGCEKDGGGGSVFSKSQDKSPKPVKKLVNKGGPPLRDGKGWNHDYESKNWWKDFLDKLADFLGGGGDLGRR